jgi:hypothetical protein
MAQHSGTGPGRGDDVVEFFEQADGLARNSGGAFPVAGVIGRLAATYLRCRYGNVAPGFFQQAGGGKPDRRAIKIDQAGGEQPYLWACGHEIDPV